MKLHKRLLLELQHVGLPPAVVREFLQAALGHKISRTSLPDKSLQVVVDALESHGLHVGISSKKFFAYPDMGKGGWCNAAPIEVEVSSQLGEHFIYAGMDPERVYFAMQHEERGSDTEFAHELGIPECCAKFFLENSTRAQELQNDLLPLTFDNSEKGYPFNYWNNAASQYFGFGLNSFFPCSFHCPNAAKVAMDSFSALEAVDQQFGFEFLAAQKMNYYYTEYDGIFQLPGSRFDGSVLRYDPSRMSGTSNGVLFTLLKKCDQIQVIDRHHYRFLSGSSIYLDDTNELSCLLVFDGH